jgi:hypothetical protein
MRAGGRLHALSLGEDQVGVKGDAAAMLGCELRR